MKSEMPSTPSSTASPSSTNELFRLRNAALGDERKPTAPVVDIAGEQANALSVPLDDQSIAIMFDLVDPIVPDRNRGAPDRDAGFKRSLTHAA